LLAIAGGVLGLGGCLAFLNDTESTLGAVGGMLFVGALFAVPIGVIWFLVGVIKAIARGWNQPAEPEHRE
jgi:hypothetical protein